MFICQLEIDGFRGIKSAKLQFQPHTVLLGPNAVLFLGTPFRFKIISNKLT